jgi:ribosomal protein L37AE/L43A
MIIIELTECPNCKSKKLFKTCSGIYVCKKCEKGFMSHVHVPAEDVFYELPKKKKYKILKPWWWHRK